MRSISEVMNNYSHQHMIIEHLYVHGINIIDSPLRIDSDGYSQLICAARELTKHGLYSPSVSEKIILENLSTGKLGLFLGNNKKKMVTMDLPINNPDRNTDNKRFIVYVPTDKKDKESGLIIVKKIKFSSWGDDLDIRNDDKGAVDSFWARHKCDMKTDRKTPGWWACYSPELFGDKLKLRGGKSRW